MSSRPPASKAIHSPVLDALSVELPPATVVSSRATDRELSLYERILESEPGLQPVSAGATTFKAALASFVDLLIELEQPTSIWARLPRGESWQLELERYCKQSSAGQMAFVLYPQQEYTQNLESAEERRLPLHISGSAPGTLELLDEGGQNLLADRALTPRVSIPLERGLMRGEYFVLAVSPGFQGLMMARRAKSAPRTQEMTELFTMAGPEGVVEPKPSKSQLRMLFSSQAATVQKVMEGIQQTLLRVPTNHLQVCLGGDCRPASIRIEPLIQQWDQLFVPTSASNAVLEQGRVGKRETGKEGAGKGETGTRTAGTVCLTDPLILKQLQHQEDLWRRLSSYRKQAEQAESLRLQNEELLNMIQLKDEFLNMVVQELRTPLTSMKTALSLLGSPNLKQPQRQRYIQLLNTECDRQNSLISGLLNLTQIEQSGETQMQSLILSDVIPGIVSTYQPLAQEKDIMLAYTIPNTLPPVATLVPWLRQIIVNLIHNSVKFTGEGGRVWVRAKPQGEYVQIDVQDTGIGISSGEIPKIFNRFYRVRPGSGEDDGGAGLGLTIVQQLLLRCGGSITVNSRLGQGSTFSVLLPVYSNEADSEEIE